MGLSADDIPEEVGYVRVSTEDQLMKALGRTDEPWSVHAHWNVPCFVRSLEGDVSPDDDEDSAPSSTPAPLPQYLSIKTCVVDRIFEADMTAIDFGELAVGETKQVPLRIRNHSSTRAPFSATGLNAVGAFSIVNALRPVSLAIAPSALCLLPWRFLSFFPRATFSYCFFLCLSFHCYTRSNHKTRRRYSCSLRLTLRASARRS